MTSQNSSTDVSATDRTWSYRERLDYIGEAVVAGHDMRTPLFQLASELLAEVDRLKVTQTEAQAAS